MNLLAALAAGVFALACLPGAAQTLNYNLTGNAGVGSVGNKLLFTQDGVSVRASSWGYTYGSGDSALEAARLAQWSVGLGVINASESDTTPEHQVDNHGPDDWVLFVFSEKVNITGVTIDPYGVYDRDVTYYVGNVATNVSLSGKSYLDLTLLGFGLEKTSNSTASEDARTVAINSPAGGVNAILFGARKGEFTDADIDRFKITAISATRIATVPEPSSLMLGAFGALALLRRRR